MKTAARNIFILLIIAATLAIIYWLIINYYDDKNRTDDAQVDGDIVPVLARTDGFVDSVYVDDDQVHLFFCIFELYYSRFLLIISVLKIDSTFDIILLGKFIYLY